MCPMQRRKTGMADGIDDKAEGGLFLFENGGFAMLAKEQSGALRARPKDGRAAELAPPKQRDGSHRRPRAASAGRRADQPRQ